MLEATEAIEVPLPSESYLSHENDINMTAFIFFKILKPVTVGVFFFFYQDRSFFASGISGFISNVLLLNVDKDTPKNIIQVNKMH